MSKRQMQKEATRKHILDTAYQIYGQHGFTVNTQTIASAAGVSHGTVFLHFPTLEDLIVCLLDRFEADIKGELHRACLTAPSLARLLSAHIDALTPHESFYTRLILDSALLPEQASITLVSIQSLLSHHFGIALDAMGRDQSVKPLPLHFLFNTWLGLLHHYLSNRHLFAPEGSVLSRYGDELISGYMALISID